jgi:adenylate kinase family enzyme
MNSVSSALLVLLGPPGSGKSTLAETLLSEHRGLGHFAVRRQFVEEKRRRTDLWLAAADSQRKRQWLPDTVVIEAFARRLDAQLPGGMLIEGLPANGKQAHLVLETVAARNRCVDKVIYLDAPDVVCMGRMRGRQVCVACDGGISQAAVSVGAPDQCARCGSALSRRADDEDIAFAERLRLHRLYIDDILQAFAPGTVTVIDGTATRREIAAGARQSLAEHILD